MTSVADIIDIFDQVFDHFWIDSGSLLGLIRDGSFISWDSDIDFGILSGEASKLLSLNEDLRKKGIRTSYRVWNGNIYGNTIHIPGVSPIHIHVYWIQGNTAWSPQTISYYKAATPDINAKQPPYPITRRALQRLYLLAHPPYHGPLLWRAFRSRIIRRAWGLFRRIRGRYPREIWASRYPFNAIHEIATWKIPAEHFKTTERRQFGSLTLPVPHSAEAYLSFRYGEWRVPQRSWTYWLDDKALHDGPPDHNGFQA